jgi:NADH:ubiquinone oxidoreductase subunit 5 (subunit L)/multisubunit Na+/H+ antiporter MnhA subunit
VIIIPLLILAFFTLTVGWIGIPEGFPVLSRLIPNYFESLFHTPVFNQTTEIPEVLTSMMQANQHYAWIPMILGIVFPFLGFIFGWHFYGRIPLETGDEDPLINIMRRFRLRWLYTVFQHRFYIDAVYQILIVKPTVTLANWVTAFDIKFIDWIVLSIGKVGSGFAIGAHTIDDIIFDPDLSRIRQFSMSNIVDWIDSYIIDEIINITGFLGEFFSILFQQIDTQLVDGLVKRIAKTTQSLGLYVRRLQNGLLSDYLWNAFLMVLLIIATISLLQ